MKGYDNTGGIIIRIMYSYMGNIVRLQIKGIIPKGLNYELAWDLMEDVYNPSSPSPYYTFLLSHILNTIHYYYRDKNRILKIIEII